MFSLFANRSLFVNWLCLVLAGFSFFSCSLNDPEPQPIAPVLVLSASQNLSLTTLSWQPVNVTDFKEYIIVQSFLPIPDFPEPVINEDITILKRIDDRQTTSFTSSEIVFTPDLCYKLYCKIGERFLYSPTICITQTFNLFDGFNDRGQHIPGTDQVAFFDRVNHTLVNYDISEDEATVILPETNLNFPVMEVSDYGGSKELYAYDQSPGKLRKYNADNLNFLRNKDFNTVVFSINASSKYLYVACEETSKTFQVLNRETLAVTDSRNGLNGNRAIAVFEGDPVVVLEIGELAIRRYEINDLGKITKVDNIVGGVNQLSVQNAMGYGQTKFIGGRQGAILNKHGETLGLLNQNPNAVIQFARFSEDENTAYYIITNNVGSKVEIADITNPAIPVIRHSFDVPQSSFSDVFIHGSILYVAGVSFNSGAAKTFILSYPTS